MATFTLAGRRRLLKMVSNGALLSLGLPLSTRAAPDSGVGARTILVGRVLPRSSTAFAAMAVQRAEGADACIAQVNEGGGVGGRRIVVKDRDDGYSGEQAAREVRALIDTEQVFAMLGTFGSPTVPAVVQVIEQAGVPLVGAASIANDARQPARKWVFPVRASAADEARATVKHQMTLGARRFLVLASKEAYGPSGATAYGNALRHAGLEVNEVRFVAADDPRQVAARVLQAKPEVLLISVLPKAFARVAGEYRAAGGAARTFGLSVIRIEDLRAELGPLAAGIGLSQPVPTPMSRTSPLANEYRELLSKHAPQANPSYHGLEGFLEAKVLVEGLRRAGQRPTRDLFVRAMETLKGHDFGGVLVRYGAGDRTGSTFSELVMLGSDGGLVR